MGESRFACEFFAAGWVAMTEFLVRRFPAARHETWGLKNQMMWRHSDVVLDVALILGVLRLVCR